MATAAQHFRRNGSHLVDFARQVVEILCRFPFGVDQDIFLLEYYGGNPPLDRATRDFEWEEFKRAKDYSNQQFDAHQEGWAWVRARRGLVRGQFFYQVVAQIVDGEPEKIIQYPISETLHLEKTAEWQTRTRSEMRVKVANIEAKKRHAIASSNQRLLNEAEQEMDEITVLAPRLAAINFDLGLTVEDLRQIARSPRIPRILQATVKRTLAAYEKSQEEIKKLSQIVYSIKQLRSGRS